MPELGRLRWVLTADTRQFDSAMRRTGQGLRRLGRLAAAGLGVRGIGSMLRRGIQTADSIAKMADAAGVSIEALQALRHTADLAGISTQKFDDALLRFSKRLGELQLHQGPLFRFLSRYDARMIRSLAATDNTTEAFVRMAEMIRGAPGRLQPALTAAAFGVGNIRMRTMMAGGAPGLAAGVRSAMENVNFITTQQARQMEQVNDTITRANERFTTEMAQMAIKVVQLVAGAVQKVERFIDSITEKTLGERFMEGAAALGRFMFPGAARTTE